jgi:hypothetical protein
MSMQFVVGSKYVVGTDLVPYAKAGSIVVRLDGGRFLVRWEDGTEDYVRNGDNTLVGCDSKTRTYKLVLNEQFIVPYADPDTRDEGRINAINDAIENGDAVSYDDMQWYASQMGSFVDGYVLADDTNEYIPKSLAYHCPVGDAYYSDNDCFRTAWDRVGNEIRAHEDTLDGSLYYFQCARNNEYYHRRNYTQVYVADLDEYWCLEENEYELNYCDDDDNYYYDSDEMPRSCHIPSYHSQMRHWVLPDGITIGVELEVYVNDPEGAYTNRASEIIGERDGSLDSHYGIEFIGPPMSYDHYLKFRNPWAVTLEAIENADPAEDSDSARKDGYGMHISIGRKDLPSDVQARFVLFINNCQEFSEFIAQRSANRWAHYDKKDVTHVRESFMTSRLGREWGSKYSATHVDAHRIEVRIFKSVTEPELFQKNIDYVYSALMFVTEHEDVADVISVQKYLSWLNDQDGYAPLKAFIGDKGAQFAESDSRRAMLTASGFIIEESDNDSTI